MGSVHWLVVGATGLVMAFLALFFGFSFVVGVYLTLHGKFSDLPAWQVGLYLALLAVHASVFGYGCVASVRSLLRRRAPKARGGAALSRYGVSHARAS